MPMPQKRTNLGPHFDKAPTLPQVDAALVRARLALQAGCEQGDLDGVALAMGVLDLLLDTRSEVMGSSTPPLS